ncbi:hypothetical protein GTY57_27340, partial [Streptomyces sp. SID5475]|nr:hypothetical protein [Streptomyces sp. SID5475]
MSTVHDGADHGGADHGGTVHDSTVHDGAAAAGAVPADGEERLRRWRMVLGGEGAD